MSNIENKEEEITIETGKETPAPEPIILTFQMSLENINKLLDILGEQKINAAGPLYYIIRSQAVEQMQALDKPTDTTVQ